MTGLNPSRTGVFPVELQTAAPTHAAVTRTSTLKGGLGRPCEGALFIGKDCELDDNLIDREQACERVPLLRRCFAGSPIIRRCMFILHDRIRGTTARQAKNLGGGQLRAVAYYLTACCLKRAPSREDGQNDEDLGRVN